MTIDKELIGKVGQSLVSRALGYRSQIQYMPNGGYDITSELKDIKATSKNIKTKIVYEISSIVAQQICGACEDKVDFKEVLDLLKDYKKQGLPITDLRDYLSQAREILSRAGGKEAIENRAYGFIQLLNEDMGVA